MSACDVLFSSFYGSTRQYAQALAHRLGVTARELEGAGALDKPTIVLAPIHGPASAGVSYLRHQTKESLQAHPVALVTVGMSLDEVAVEKDFAAKLLGDRASCVTRFYLPGRLNYSELSTAHSATMRGVISALKLKPRKSDNDRMMIDTYGKDVDRVDVEKLDPIVEWARAL